MKLLSLSRAWQGNRERSFGFSRQDARQQRQHWRTGACQAVLVTACLALCGTCRAKDTLWLHVGSPNFEVYCGAGPGAARETLQHFEFLRSFFQQTLGDSAEDRRPVSIVVFGSEKEYAHYQHYGWSDASFDSHLDSDIIAMKAPSVRSFSTAAHEYFHVWAHRQQLELPLWLNEGLAQLYSTVRPTLGGQVVGDLPPGFEQYLSRYRWAPLQTILSAQQYPRTDRNREVGDFYLVSWALTHMLELSADYRGGAPKLLPLIQDGLPSAEAITTTYGKSLSDIEVDLRAYLQFGEFRNELYRAKVPKPPKPTVIEPSKEYEQQLVLLQLLDPRDKTDEIRAGLTALMTSDSNRPEVHAELGNLAAYQGDLAAAVQEYRRAFSLGGLGPNGLWRYGRLLADEPSNAIEVFGRLLRLDPNRVDARLELARMQMATKDAASALGTLALVHAPAKVDAADYFHLLTAASLEVGTRQEAAGAAHNWEQTAQDDVEKSAAAHLIGSLEAGQARGDTEAEHHFEAGQLVEVGCRDRDFVLTVQTATGRRVFLARDSGRVTTHGKNGGFGTVACGEQQEPAKVRIEYGRPLRDIAGVDGVVKSIEFR